MEQKITIEIDTHDENLENDLMETLSPSIDQQKEMPGGALINYKGRLTELKESISAKNVLHVITLLLTFGGNVASGLIANWLYEKIKGKATKIRIQRKEIQIDEGEIKKIIDEIIEAEEK